MGKRRKQITFYNYECTITGDRYKRTKKISNTDELVSVEAYYQLNPDKDDRPKVIKKKLGVDEETEVKTEVTTEVTTEA